MSRRIFIMQRNEADTAWETKTISGVGLPLVTDGNGGLAMGDPPYVLTPSSSRSGNIDYWVISSSYTNATLNSNSAPTCSFDLDYQGGFTHINRAVVVVKNTAGGNKQIRFDPNLGPAGATTISDTNALSFELVRIGLMDDSPNVKAVWSQSLTYS